MGLLFYRVLGCSFFFEGGGDLGILVFCSRLSLLSGGGVCSGVLGLGWWTLGLSVLPWGFASFSEVRSPKP